MGKAYFERVLRQPDPTVGLLNVGEEESKGNLLAREAYALLRRTEPNFVGNIEGNALLDGHADVVVTDGFNGNIAVKVAEGVAAFLAGQLRRGIRSKPRYVAGRLVHSRRLRRTPREHGLSGEWVGLPCSA